MLNAKRQLAIFKHDRGVELGSVEKQLQLSGQRGTWNRDLWISSPKDLQGRGVDIFWDKMTNTKYQP